MIISPQLKQKLYIASAIIIAISIVVAVIIWRQFGNPFADSAAVDQSSASATPTLNSPPQPTPTPSFTNAPPSIIGYSGQDGKAALELLLQLYPATKTTGDGVNKAVVAINGQPAASQNKIWNFYLNGALAQVAPATYLTVTSDQIEWRLEEF